MANKIKKTVSFDPELHDLILKMQNDQSFSSTVNRLLQSISLQNKIDGIAQKIDNQMHLLSRISSQNNASNETEFIDEFLACFDKPNNPDYINFGKAKQLKQKIESQRTH